MECHCHLRKFQDALADGRIQYEKGVKAPLDGPMWRYGAEIFSKPSHSKIKKVVFTSSLHRRSLCMGEEISVSAQAIGDAVH